MTRNFIIGYSLRIEGENSQPKINCLGRQSSAFRLFLCILSLFKFHFADNFCVTSCSRGSASVTDSLLHNFYLSWVFYCMYPEMAQLTCSSTTDIPSRCREWKESIVMWTRQCSLLSAIIFPPGNFIFTSKKIVPLSLPHSSHYFWMQHILITM